MLLNKLIPPVSSRKDAAGYILEMLTNAFYQIDHLESQLADAEEQLRCYSKILSVIGKGVKLEHGHIVIWRSIFPDDSEYDLIKSMFDLKEKEEIPED